MEDGFMTEGLGDMETRRFGEGETKALSHKVTQSAVLGHYSLRLTGDGGQDYDWETMRLGD